MEKQNTPIVRIYQALQKLIGLHRQLLDAVRIEREALIQAELKAIQDSTFAKQGLIESIRLADSERMKHVAELAILWKKPIRDLTIQNIVFTLQEHDLKTADQFRSLQNTLTILIQRISEQNEDNRGLVEKSLLHVREMKKNVLGESVPLSDVYTQSGQKAAGISGARLISKEA